MKHAKNPISLENIAISLENIGLKLFLSYLHLRETLPNNFHLILFFSWPKTKPNEQKHLRIHWRLSTILKTSKKAYEVMLFDMENLVNTLYIELKKQCWKVSFRKNKRYKKYTLFFFESSNLLQIYFSFAFLVWVEAQG